MAFSEKRTRVKTEYSQSHCHNTEAYCKLVLGLTIRIVALKVHACRQRLLLQQNIIEGSCNLFHRTLGILFEVFISNEQVQSPPVGPRPRHMKAGPVHSLV